LREFDKDIVAKVAPLPAAKQLESFEYDPAGLRDPFQPRGQSSR
jgi:Tfp pilus assembly protein PilP